MKKFWIALSLIILPVCATAAGWPLCQSKDTVGALYAFLASPGADQPEYIQWIRTNVDFVQADFVRNEHRQAGDYQLTTCKARFRVTTPDGTQQYFWDQVYVVRNDTLWDIKRSDAIRFVETARRMAEER